MTRWQGTWMLAVAAVLATALVAAAQAQAAEASRSGFGRGLGRSRLIGLLRLEQVQKELKLSEEQVANVRKIDEDLFAEMRQQYAAVREMEDRQQQREKMSELRDQFDRQARKKLRDVLAREQMMRLYQIRLQVRPVVESLANRYVAGRLKLTDEQKEGLAQINKEVQAKRSDLFSSMRNASREQRGEVFRKFRQLSSEADEKGLGLLTDEQKKTFEEMKGKKIELGMRRGR